MYSVFFWSNCLIKVFVVNIAVLSFVNLSKSDALSYDC